MPKLTQYLVVKKQIESFKVLGFKTEFDIQNVNMHFNPKIRLCKDTHEYKFYERDWNLVTLKLAKLYTSLK